MSNKDHLPNSRRLAATVTVAASALLGLGAITSGVQAAPGIAQPDANVPLILASTDGMDRRDDNRDDRQEDRGDCDDNRQDCRQEKGSRAVTSATESRIIVKDAVTVWVADRIAVLITDRTNDRIPLTGRKTGG